MAKGRGDFPETFFPTARVTTLLIPTSSASICSYSIKLAEQLAVTAEGP